MLCGHYVCLSNLNKGPNAIVLSLPSNTLTSVHSGETCLVASTAYGEKVYLAHPSCDVPKKSMGMNKESSTAFGVSYIDSHDDKVGATFHKKTTDPPK